MRRIAVNSIKGDIVINEPAWIELSGDFVSAYGVLREEMPMTEWLGGELVLQYTAHKQLIAIRNGQHIIE